MSTANGRTAVTHPATARQRPLPFWLLQLSELVVAVVLVDVSVHVRGGGSLVVAGVGFAVLAALAQGPLGLVRLCPQRLHVALIVTVAALAAASPVLPALRPDVQGIIVLEFAAVGLLRMATLTRTSDRPGRLRGTNPVIDTTASVVDRAATTPRPQPGSPTGPAGTSAARQAGRAAGAAAASGRHLVETHRPAAEAGLKRSIRTAGRWAGRLTARLSEDHSPPP